MASVALDEGEVLPPHRIARYTSGSRLTTRPGGVMCREVTMIEIAEVLRLWRDGLPTKRLAAQLGLDPKTVRRYSHACDEALASAVGKLIQGDEKFHVDSIPPQDEAATIAERSGGTGPTPGWRNWQTRGT